MFLPTENHSISSGGVLRTARATVKATAKVFNMFANDIYTDKPRAILRELVANAVDAHVMAGTPEAQVGVILPTELDPQLTVRDRGIGMSAEFMLTKFMAYSDSSTKENDNTAIGGWGLGSKSPFSMVDQFIMRVVHDGSLGVYSVFKDTDGCPSIAELSQSPTNEPNGVEVSFPVEAKDIPAFQRAALNALPHFLPLPDVKNLPEPLTAPTYVAAGSNWGLRKDAGYLKVVMGGVAYDCGNLYYQMTGVAETLQGYGLDIVLPIGTCSVALSREALSLDGPTIEAIQAALEAVSAEVAESFSTAYDHHETKWLAVQAFSANLADVPHQRKTFLSEHAKYRGEKLEEVINLGEKVSGQYALTVEAKRSSTLEKLSFSGVWNAHIRPGAVRRVIYDDLDTFKPSKQRLQARIREDGRPGTLILKCHSGRLRQLLAALGNPDFDLASDFDLPISVRQARTSVKFIRPRVRMFQISQYAAQDSYGYRPYRVDGTFGYQTEVPDAEQPETGIYVQMELFKPEAARLQQKFATGLIDHDEVFFINRGDVAKLKGWTDFDTVFNARLAARLKSDPKLATRLSVSNHTSLTSWFDRVISPLSLHTYKGRLTPTLRRLVDLYKANVLTGRNDDRQIAPFLTVPPFDFSNDETTKTLNAENPDLSWMLHSMRSGRITSVDASVGRIVAKLMKAKS